MSAGRIATRYAKSLIDLATERNQLDEIFNEIKSFEKNITDNRDLYLLLKSPIITPDKKMTCLNAIYDGKVSTLFQEFINIVVRKRRENFLPEMADAFILQYNKIKGQSHATLITATPVDEALKSKIQTFVMDNTPGAKSVEVKNIIDESIIGGFILNFGDNQYDASVKNKLKSLKKKFSINKYIKQY